MGRRAIQSSRESKQLDCFAALAMTVAGFVEDAEALAKLAEMGVECVQGYLIGEPRALESLA